MAVLKTETKTTVDDTETEGNGSSCSCNNNSNSRRSGSERERVEFLLHSDEVVNVTNTQSSRQKGKGIRYFTTPH